jgi:hypothetical protein
MSDAPIDILRRFAERKKAYTGYEINELNEITPPSRPPATSEYQPTDGSPDETYTGYELNEITPPETTEWRKRVAALDPDRSPRDVPARRWTQFIIDALRLFRDGTIAQAIDLGWDALDLFGCDDRAPYARIDQMGLVWLVAGNRVVSISSSAAVIETRTGSRQTYRRRTGEPGRVLAWQLTP